MMRLQRIILLWLFSCSVTAIAAENTLSPAVYQPLVQAQQLMAEGKHNIAVTQLQALLNNTDRSRYETAVVRQTLGYAYAEQDNYREAIARFEQAMEDGQLPSEVDHAIRFHLGQLFLLTAQYQQGVSVLARWIQNEPKPTMQARLLLANGYYQIEQYQYCITQLEQALAEQEDKATIPETAEQLLLAAYIEAKVYHKAIRLLEKLIVRAPKASHYWQQLAALYGQQEKHKAALAVQVLAQRIQPDDGSVWLRLADLYRYLDIPYRAAQLLTQKMATGQIATNQANLQRLADSWLAAKEKQKAIGVLTQLAQYDTTGEVDFLRGQLFYQLSDWSAATQALQRSQRHLTGNKRATARLLLAQILYQQGRLQQALTAFQALTDHAVIGRQASSWSMLVSQIIEQSPS